MSENHRFAACSFQDFTILKELQRSPNGAVYKARFRFDGKTYALKERKVSEMGRRKNIMSEVNLLRSLDHDNVVKCEGWIFDEKRKSLIIVLEYCENGDLHNLITKFRRVTGGRMYLSESYIWYLFQQICEGVFHLHENGIVHRDLKTLNIMLRQGGRRIKIVDLGVSRQLSEDTIALKTFYGTPLYLSPELVQNLPYNEKTDIWSLGVILYELCTLVAPFSGRNIMDLAQNIVRGTYPAIPSVYSKEMSKTIGHMLLKDPAKRLSIFQLCEICKKMAPLSHDLEIPDAVQRIVDPNHRSEENSNDGNKGKDCICNDDDDGDSITDDELIDQKSGEAIVVDKKSSIVKEKGNVMDTKGEDISARNSKTKSNGIEVKRSNEREVTQHKSNSELGNKLTMLDDNTNRSQRLSIHENIFARVKPLPESKVTGLDIPKSKTLGNSNEVVATNDVVKITVSDNAIDRCEMKPKTVKIVDKPSVALISNPQPAPESSVLLDLPRVTRYLRKLHSHLGRLRQVVDYQQDSAQSSRHAEKDVQDMHAFQEAIRELQCCLDSGNLRVSEATLKCMERVSGSNRPLTAATATTLSAEDAEVYRSSSNTANSSQIREKSSSPCRGKLRPQSAKLNRPIDVDRDVVLLKAPEIPSSGSKDASPRVIAPRKASPRKNKESAESQFASKWSLDEKNSNSADKETSSGVTCSNVANNHSDGNSNASKSSQPEKVSSFVKKGLYRARVASPTSDPTDARPNSNPNLYPPPVSTNPKLDNIDQRQHDDFEISANGKCEHPVRQGRRPMSRFNIITGGWS